MFTLPDTLEDATDQAIAALGHALDGGLSRLILDLRFDDLKPLPVAYGIAQYLSQRYQSWQALFADAGTAALAKRDWGETDWSLRSVQEGRRAVRPEDQAFLLVAPSVVEVDQLEKLLALAGDRPFIMFNPRLESTEIGIGLTARRLRQRFLNTFTTAYYLQPLEQGALWRCYPQNWQVWRNPQVPETTMQLIYESSDRPSLEQIDQLFRPRTGQSLLSRLQNFFTALRS
jgi:hypothetical protein